MRPAEIALLLSALVALCPAVAPAQAADGKSPGQLVSGGNEFCFDLYGKLIESEKGNLFFSPYSISTAMGMAYAGSRGQTAEQIAKGMHLPLPPAQIGAAFAEQIKAINVSSRFGDQEAFKLVVANSLWGQAGYPFHKEYQDLLHKDFGAMLSETDFARDGAGSARKINDWVAQKTNDKIKDLLPSSGLDPMTRLVLVNAIYFKSNWADQFSKNATKDEAFHVDAATTVKAPMMHQVHRFPYTADDDLQMLELPYQGYRLSMYVLLPRKADGLAALEKSFNAQRLAKLTADLQTHKMDLSLPKFKMTSRFSLSSTLAALGMPDAFTDKADFSGIASVEKLFVSAVIHQAYVDVNEEGTEAAAATAVAMAASAMPRPEEPIVFKADHPFLFLICHRQSGEVLFMGRVTNPK